MSSEQVDTNTTNQTAATTMTVEEVIAHAKRAFALKKYEQAVDHYATALELVTNKFGDSAPETADLYFSYGKALLENAISQNSVLGKEQTEEAVNGPADEESPVANKFLSFSGDADDGDAAADIFAEAQKAGDAEEEGDDDEEDDEEAEPEDDFNAAWEVLELARAIYEKQQDEGDEVKLKLADTLMALGDVSLETEKFDQAITDYSAALKLKTELLPLSSRQIAEAHYRLSIVLDLTSGRLGDAIVHVERALESVEARLAELRDALSGQGLVPPPSEQDSSDAKGKGKAKTSRLLEVDSIYHLSKSEKEAEVKDLQELREDLAAKIEELKANPEQAGESAPTLAAKALDKELNAGPAAALPQTINDLTSVVKKKKKEPQTPVNGATKRKAEDEVPPPAPTEKKAKVSESES